MDRYSFSAILGVCLLLLTGCQVPVTENIPPSPSEIADPSATKTDGSATNAVSTVTDTETKNPEKLEEIAIEYVRRTQNVSLDYLTITNTTTVEYETLNESYYKVKVLDETQPNIHVIGLDWTGNIVNLSNVEERVRQKYVEKYGNLDPHLYQVVKNASEDEYIKISVWITVNKSGRPPYSDQIKKETRQVANKIRKLDGVKDIAPSSVAAFVKLSATPAAIKDIEKMDEVAGISHAASQGSDG